MKRSWDVLIYRADAPTGTPPRTYIYAIPEGEEPAAHRPNLAVWGGTVLVERGEGEGQAVVPLERVDRIEVRLNKGGEN